MFERPLKNAYIGEVYEYSYDFRNKSSAIITADGFVSKGTSPSFGTNGIYGNSIRVLRQIPDLTNAKKITYTLTGKIGTSGSSDLYYRTIQWDGVSESYATNRTGVNSGYSNYNETFYGGGTAHSFSFTSSNGSIAYTHVLDLENKTAVLTFSAGASSTYNYTLSDTEVTGIRTNNYLYIFTNGSSPKITSIGIIIE